MVLLENIVKMKYSNYGQESATNKGGIICSLVPVPCEPSTLTGHLRDGYRGYKFDNGAFHSQEYIASVEASIIADRLLRNK